MTYIIVDPGSTHNGELTKALDLITLAKRCGADAIKFQLFEDIPKYTDSGNIPMDDSWIPYMVKIANKVKIKLFFSEFKTKYFNILSGCTDYIKFAYSQNNRIDDIHAATEKYRKVFVSVDTMHPQNWISSSKIHTLYCIPQYPVPYQVNFEGIFPRFDGFSSHCLGIQQEINAVKAGSKYLEFHMKGDWDSDCPDHRFAKSPKETKQLIKEIRCLT